MYILGISCHYHDAAASLLKDGVFVAAAEEERFTRKKHDTSFPINAARYCLESQGITADELTAVAFYEKPMLKFERILHQHLHGFPRSYKSFLSSMPSWINEKLRVMRSIRKKLKFHGDVYFIDHHLSHAASTFLCSPFEEAAILTVDGVGEWSTATWGVGDGNKIHLAKEMRFPHSLGLLYSTITAYLGFSVNNSEYKVMGLSAYGKMDREKNPYYKKMRRTIDINTDGSVRMQMKYFIYDHADRMPSKDLCALLGGPVRTGGELTQRHKDIAAALQMVLEDALTTMLTHVHRQTGLDALVYSGGVALNSVYNGKILRNTPFKRIWMQPNATDGGTSMGAASFVYHSLLGKKRRWILKDAYLGPSFTTKEVKKFISKNHIKHTEFRNDKDIVETTARLLHESNVIGWFQGGMEWGPRALGARSILSDPTNIQMQDILNLKVKHREKFRPFAPVVCEDDAQRYFDCNQPIPDPTDFMLMVYPIRKEWHAKIPSVTHVDGSGRLQTIRRGQNALYYDVIKAFGKRSGIPILINTSFNIRGEPIVCTPHDAYKCMMGTGIDYLVMDRFLIKRADNPKHMWDSEQYAND
ncbi:MAG: carbamoyltransferase [Nanoarchaeota archaeon]